MRKNFPMTCEEQVVFLDDLLNDRMRQLRVEIANYREKIAAATDPVLKATFGAVLELTERELEMHQRNKAARDGVSLAHEGSKVEELAAWFDRSFG